MKRYNITEITACNGCVIKSTSFTCSSEQYLQLISELKRSSLVVELENGSYQIRWGEHLSTITEIKQIESCGGCDETN